MADEKLQPPLGHYIPAGCLHVSRVNDVEAPASQQWTLLTHPQETTPSDELQHALPRPAQVALLRHPVLRPYTHLFNKRWIRIEVPVRNEYADTEVARVYILPDDVDRSLIDRSDESLQRIKRRLLMDLDFSRGVWENGCGKFNARVQFPQLSTQDETDDPDEQDREASLLQMFNSIPSPKPEPGLVHDTYGREAMTSLLDSSAPGLKTTLYPYQRRSAALMLQKEAQPRQVLDPRLVKVVDQRAEFWYLNPVTGLCLREPRYYEGVKGGILAEEMGSGKTLICLSLILATKHQPAHPPEIFRGANVPVRRSVGSLMDMVASSLTRNSVPWSLYFDEFKKEGYAYQACINAINRNPGSYEIPRLERRRGSRQPQVELAPTRVFLSRGSVIIVPANLLQQWTLEISKHTEGLDVLVLQGSQNIPAVEELLKYDIILFTIPYLEKLWSDHYTMTMESPLAQVHFKRCIVDEGHKLGNAKIGGRKTNLLLVLECLHFSARWIVTGTPSQGLFGVDDQSPVKEMSNDTNNLVKSSNDQERKDLERIGSIATLYLKARPWANTVGEINETGDTPADWKVYVMQPRHSARSSGRKDCLRATFGSLIIRHRLSEVGDLLPPVEEKVVFLDGSYQDKLSLNLFSMMIIFNAVQSQRTDQDYFFHPRQRKSLLQLVQNLRQSSFFGGSFFSTGEIHKSVETAEKFLEEKKVSISSEDERLLRDAIAFGKVAFLNKVKEAANLFHEMPIFVKDFPGGLGQAWSMDGKDRDPVCTNSKLVRSLQKLLNPWVDSPEGLNMMFNSGKFVDMGKAERQKELEAVLPTRRAAETEAPSQGPTLAGNTKLGDDSTRKRQSSAFRAAAPDEPPTPPQTPDREVAGPLASTQIISTFSAKLSYVVDAIMEHQDDEQIIIFYENDNVAWYLAGMLENLQIHHLIYAKGITTARRAQYVATFNSNPKFRVLLMDITQAAFGLDMRSASRIYFINPVLNPQVEAQAIGRVRRISQKKKVSVETLVLRGSLEEVIVDRKGKMTQAEHRKCKTILDDRPIYDWILNAKIIAMPDEDLPEPDQMAPLRMPQFVFGREFGREQAHPDEDLVTGDETLSLPNNTRNTPQPSTFTGLKRKFAGSLGGDSEPSSSSSTPVMRARRVKFAGATDDEASTPTRTPSPPPKKVIRVRFADE